MGADTQADPPTDITQLEEQLYRYAQELHDLYWDEKREREALAEEKLVLEYRLKELSALNKLFQQHLERKQRLEETLQEVTATLQHLLAQRSEASLWERLEHLLTFVRQATGAPGEGAARVR